jgi:hypothetical protein
MKKISIPRITLVFGLLSVNKWRDLVVGTVRSKITNFTLTNAEHDSLEKEVEGVLNALITKGDSLMNAPQKSVGGKLRKLAFHTFINEDKLRQSVPAFSQKIMAQLMKPSSKRKLAYAVDSIYQKYQVTSEDAFDKKTETALSLLRQRMYVYVPLYAMSILFALILLLTGLTSTMIEIDARIESLDFHLIGASISFKNQVLFFQSKSIVDVVALLNFAFHSGGFTSIATNHTSLQPGYIVFVGFVLLGLVLSQILKWMTETSSSATSKTQPHQKTHV